MSDGEWKQSAACRGVDTAAVFYPEIPSGDVRDFYWRKARAYCGVCRVRADCLAYVLPFERAAGRRDGMWGGLTPREREQHERPREGVPIRFRA